MHRSLQDAGGDDEDTRPKDWDAKARQQAQDALERDRAMRGQDAMARHLREMAGKAEKKLRDNRIDEDGEYAVELLARDIEESEDRLFAEALVAIEAKHREATAEADRHAVEAVAKLRQKEISLAMKNDILTQGYSNIPDQGIEWRDKVPYEVIPARTRGSSVASQQRYAEKRSETAKPIKRGISEAQKSAEKPVKEFYLSPHTTANAPVKQKEQSTKVEVQKTAGNRGGNSSGDSSESSSDESDRKPAKSDTDSVFEDKRAKNKSKKARNKSRRTVSMPPGMTPDRDEQLSDDSSESSDDSSSSSDSSSSGSSGSSGSSSSDDDLPAKGKSNVFLQPKKGKRSKNNKRKRNSRRKHHKKKKDDSHDNELNDPRFTGISSKNIVKWRRSLHDGYRRYYKEMLGKRTGMESVFDEHKNLKLPAPTKYTGSADVAKFDEMVVGLFRWMQALNLGGKKNDKKRRITLGFYLAGPALDWLNDQVEGLYRVKRKWTFIEIILGLFDRFVDTTCIQEATEQFWHAKFSKEIGIMGFYPELMTACRRMIKRPDSYTFKNHMLSRMPADMVAHLIERNVTAECSSIRKILENASNYEYQRSVGR
ncbi:hypothetical protein C8J57DRAFT_1499230 [Mycena rebaudengoi]|nr:hypothetical protein C8J57DRAFT_1499230 [Mycena rebaudengoi]